VETIVHGQMRCSILRLVWYSVMIVNYNYAHERSLAHFHLLQLLLFDCVRMSLARAVASLLVFMLAWPTTSLFRGFTSSRHPHCVCRSLV